LRVPFLLSDLLGLPAHPLLVHAAVVLVPLVAFATALTCWRPAWRRHHALPLALLAVVAAVFAFLAKESGEPLQGAVRRAAQAAGAARPRYGDHPEEGDTAFFFSAVFAAVMVAFWAAVQFRERLRLPAWSGLAGYALVLAAGALAAATMVVAGHSGAQLVWKDVGSYAAGR
jgi:uncharacterized membrane protein